jgi:hypothetical protein
MVETLCIRRMVWSTLSGFVNAFLHADYNHLSRAIEAGQVAKFRLGCFAVKRPAVLLRHEGDCHDAHGVHLAGNYPVSQDSLARLQRLDLVSD